MGYSAFVVHCNLFASIFDSDLQVPSDYVAAEPSLRKKCHKVKGTAGPKRQCIFQAARNDKKQKVSKIKYMEMEGAASQVVIPEVVLPSSDNDFEGCLSLLCLSL